ncbi:MAG: hypothetical protein IJB36_04990 [Clostridia bacterium]|nr:hypothetical protein [Clostridia bacterium]
MKKRMRLFLMSLVCGILPITLLLGGIPVAAYTGSSAKDLTAGADIRVMSYNTLVDNDESLGGWSWGQPLGNRGDKAAAAINYYKPDVIGLQENNYKWHVSLRKNLPDYDYVNADVPMGMPLEARESLGKKDWMCTTMMYNTKTLELVDRELYGYSCNYWGCIQRMRYVSMALFKVKKTGEHFVFISTHLDAEKDSKGQSMRRQQATELAEAINYYKDTYGYPVISTGDYNSGYNNEPISIVREQAEMTSHGNNRGGIDYVLYSEGISAKYFTVVNDADVRGASDHQPIFADLSLDNGFAFPTTTVPTESTTIESPTTTTTTTTTRPTALRPTAAATTTTVKRPTESAPTVTVAQPSTTETVTGSSASQGEAADVPIDTPISTTEYIYGPGVEADDIVTTTSTTAASEVEDDNEEVEAKIVKKGNDKLYIVIAVAIAAVGVLSAVAAILVRKKK